MGIGTPRPSSPARPAAGRSRRADEGVGAPLCTSARPAGVIPSCYSGLIRHLLPDKWPLEAPDCSIDINRAKRWHPVLHRDPHNPGQATNAAARPERIFHDDQLTLELRIPFNLGPLYRVGELKVIGLTPELEAKARKTWKAQPGDPYDYQYANEFLKGFVQSVTPGQFKKISSAVQKRDGNVMDITLLFEAR